MLSSPLVVIRRVLALDSMSGLAGSHTEFRFPDSRFRRSKVMCCMGMDSSSLDQRDLHGVRFF